ncbi:MAG: hypothetical protein Q4B52_06645 [Tissierellia bacterium]|nr:hypothetical protein [Tissierellia bacterium]
MFIIQGDLNEENITDLIDDFKNSNDNIFNEEDIQIEESETKQNSIKKRSKRSISLNTTTTIDSFKIRANDGSAPVNINNNMGSLITKLTIADAAKAGDSFKIEHKI